MREDWQETCANCWDEGELEMVVAALPNPPKLNEFSLGGARKGGL